jgi:histidinol dehydrogenase
MTIESTIMKKYEFPSTKEWEEIARRPTSETRSLEKTVRKILEKVNKKGDKAIRKYTREFDDVSLKSLTVPAKEISNASTLLDDQLKQAIQQAKNNIERFHQSQKEETRFIEIMPGVSCWRRSVPINSVGLYIPGGTAPLFSTVLMLGVPAKMAGCSEIILCSPPGKDGKIHPAILFAAELCGITSIFKCGGVQAIAAMAYGTSSIPRVKKIFGPGNQFVTMAKQLIQQEGIAIDMPAGPSELLVIADDTAVPAFVAADLLSQAEHGPDSQVILVSTSKKLAESVVAEIEKQLPTLPRKNVAEKSLLNSKLLVMEDIGKALAFSNYYAPEHLILSCNNASALAGDVNAAGSVFIGNYSPESAGDYASGSNHVLPTNGHASAYSGVSLDSFVKKITFQQLSSEGLELVGDTVMRMASAEGLEAHANAIAIRLKNAL